MLKGIFRHPVRSPVRESLSSFFTNNKNVLASSSLEAKTTCLSLYQLFQSLKKYRQHNAKWIISPFSMLHSRYLPAILIRSQGIPDCSAKFPMSCNCRFRLGDQVKVFRSYWPKGFKRSFCKCWYIFGHRFLQDSKFCPVWIMKCFHLVMKCFAPVFWCHLYYFFILGALLDSLFPLIVRQKTSVWYHSIKWCDIKSYLFNNCTTCTSLIKPMEQGVSTK